MTDDPHLVRRGELDIIQIDNAACSAEISLFGGHVLQWQPSGQKPVLWMSDNAVYDSNTALRGGIPICWPWFGAVEGKGRHGLVRTQQWQLVEFLDEGNTTYVELQLCLSEHQNPWPHPSLITLQISCGECLTQKLIISNNTNKPQCFSFALHNYFTVSHPSNLTIPLFQNCLFEDKLTGQQQQLEDRDGLNLGYYGPIDRIYQSQDSVEIIDHEWHRTILIEKQNADHWVVWNPGTDADQMSDVHDGGETQFLCVETAQTTDVILKPGETQEVLQSLSVRFSETS